MIRQNVSNAARVLKHASFNDGVPLVHGGHLIEWEDTNIAEILRRIRTKKEKIGSMSLNVGNLLKNIYTGQKAAVSYINKKSVSLTPAEKSVTYPVEKIFYHYVKSEPDE